MRLALCYRTIYGNQNLAIHAAGCADLARERSEHDANINEGDYTSVDEALVDMLDEEMTEMGYDRSHVRVYPCCKSGPKAAKPLAAGICPGTGGPFKENPNTSFGRRLYAPCASCGKPVGTGTGKVPRHKPRAPRRT